MRDDEKLKTLIDLEKLNTLNEVGCPACGRKFELGESVVLACGNWEGKKYIHEDESVYDSKTHTCYEKLYFETM